MWLFFLAASIAVGNTVELIHPKMALGGVPGSWGSIIWSKRQQHGWQQSLMVRADEVLPFSSSEGRPCRPNERPSTSGSTQRKHVGIP